MCGIVAIIGQQANAKKQERASMLQKVITRGEVTETFESDQILTGTIRLKIVDGEHAMQPILSQDGSKLIIFNGEIFNFKEIRQTLSDTYNFKTQSDTEVILYAYQKYGKDCLTLFEGQFGFVIYDLVHNTYFAARDRFGIVPLYYSIKDSEIYFASHIRALTFLNTKIEQIAPGEYSDNGIKSRYYDATFTSKQWNEAELKTELKSAVQQAVSKRIQTDLKVGVIYSGGLDSSIVLNEIHKQKPDVIAFTVGTPGSEDFEISQRFCKERGIKQIVIPLSRKDITRQKVQQAIQISELAEYLDIINAVISVELFKRIHQEGIKIVLGGDCSDELFGGYDMYKKISAEKCNELFLYKLNTLYHTELQRIDRCSMGFEVEARVPFLDNAVVAIALTLGQEWKIRDGVEKWILRQAFADELPDYIIKRTKNPLSYSSGAHEWVRRYKPVFKKLYDAEKYYLHDTIKKDFSAVLRERGYDLTEATRDTYMLADYSKLELYKESLKSLYRHYFPVNKR